MRMKRVGHLGGNILGGDRFTFYPEMWNWLIEKYKVKTVFDVGCGEGQSTEYFAQKCQVTGLEGLQENITNSKVADKIVLHDLTKGPLVISKFDLVWCCEVVEHIDVQFLPNLMKTLLCGKTIAISHAVPGQRGHHHVNCQPKEYWVAEFAKYGATLLQEDSDHAKSLCPTRSHFRNTGLIFSNPI